MAPREDCGNRCCFGKEQVRAAGRDKIHQYSGHRTPLDARCRRLPQIRRHNVLEHTYSGSRRRHADCRRRTVRRGQSYHFRIG